MGIHTGWAWRAQAGHLQNAGSGKKVCYFEQGQKECYHVSLIMAPYRVSVRNYAIEATVRFPATIGAPGLAGVVLRAHGTSIDPAPYLVADLGDFSTDCEGPAWPPGTVAPGECGSRVGLRVTRSHDTDPGVAGAISVYRTDRGWHTWRVEVRDMRYRLLLDGKVLEAASDERPESALGTRFGFFLTFDPFFGNPRRCGYGASRSTVWTSDECSPC